MDTGRSDTGKSFELERHPGFARLALNPNLNAYQWADIERSAAEILTALESAKASGVIVDLSQLDYLGSAQLTLLVRVWKAIKAGNGRMVVLVTAPVVREVLNTAGLSNLWEFSDNLAGAYQMLGLRSDGGGSGGLTLAVPVVGLVALAGLAALLLNLVKLEARVALIAQLGLAGVAAAAGVWLIMKTAGMRRNLGIVIVAAAAVLAVAGILRAPVGNAPAAPPAEKKEDSKSETSGAEADAAGTEKSDADKTGDAEAGDKKEDSEQAAPKSAPLKQQDE